MAISTIIANDWFQEAFDQPTLALTPTYIKLLSSTYQDLHFCGKMNGNIYVLLQMIGSKKAFDQPTLALISTY